MGWFETSFDFSPNADYLDKFGRYSGLDAQDRRYRVSTVPANVSTMYPLSVTVSMSTVEKAMVHMLRGGDTYHLGCFASYDVDMVTSRRAHHWPVQKDLTPAFSRYTSGYEQGDRRSPCGCVVDFISSMKSKWTLNKCV